MLICSTYFRSTLHYLYTLKTLKTFSLGSRLKCSILETHIKEIVNTYQPPLTLFRMGLFWAVHGREGVGRRGAKKAPSPPLPRISHTYPTMIKLDTVIPYQQKIQKSMNHVTHPLSSADMRFFCHKSANFVASGNTDIDSILIHNFWFFKLVFSL